ncbi:MAG: hypothetical protein HQL73_09280 [Magnetococcales bacterium]|nr:hypothetical protein [Magnetococcales bacterium]
MSPPIAPDTIEQAHEIIGLLYRNLEEGTKKMSEAEDLVQANKRVTDLLLASVESILGTITQIKKVASQTKLLAINAGIEAAQAGDSGRGFLVVAEEVKELSKQTSAATTNITREIQGIQSVTDEAAVSLKAMIRKLSEIREANNEILSMMRRGR